MQDSHHCPVSIVCGSVFNIRFVADIDIMAGSNGKLGSEIGSRQRGLRRGSEHRRAKYSQHISTDIIMSRRRYIGQLHSRSTDVLFRSRM